MDHLQRIQSEHQKVRNFNRCCPVGQKVILTKDDGSTLETKTRSSAEMLSGHTAVVWLEGVFGCYALSSVKTIPDESPTDTELLDFLQGLTEEPSSRGYVVCRMSTARRGWRLHETSEKRGTPSVREAIIRFMREHTEETDNA